jgi:ComF family protein
VPGARPRDKTRVTPALAMPLEHLRRAAAALLAFPLPPRCAGCGTIVGTDHSFCLRCWQSLDFLGGPACACCGEPLELALEATRCGACLADPPPFARARAAVAYGPIARALALKLKYGQRPGVARTMAQVMRRAGTELAAGALVVPVPLHRRRLWWRGYNQAALIARALVALTGGELALDVLQRRRATPILRGLGRSRRARVVEGAFAIRDRARVKGRRVLLIDDVLTTGATVRACARALRGAGAAEVDILCWARVVRGEEERVR